MRCNGIGVMDGSCVDEGQMEGKLESTTLSAASLSPIAGLNAQRNAVDPVRFVGQPQDSARKNCEFAEEKWSGAGEGNRTLVFVGTGQLIENRRKNARFCRPLGAGV